MLRPYREPDAAPPVGLIREWNLAQTLVAMAFRQAIICFIFTNYERADALAVLSKVYPDSPTRSIWRFESSSERRLLR